MATAIPSVPKAGSSTAAAPAAWAAPAGATGLGLVAAGLYLRTLTPGLGGSPGSAELQHAAYTLGVVHPTGYPLYLLLGRAWITLLPWGAPAWRVNLLSAVFAVAAVLVVYATVVWLTGQPLAGLLAGGLAATQGLLWDQAVVAGVHSLTLLLVGGALYALVRWRGSAWPLEIAVLSYGLSLANEWAGLLLAPGLLVFVLSAVRAGRPIGPAALLRSLAALLLPLGLYLYIPLRAATAAWYNNTWDGFRLEVGGADPWAVIRDAPARPLPARVDLLANAIIPAGSAAIGLVLLALLLAGLLALRRGVAAEPPRRLDGALLALYGLPLLLIAGLTVVYDADGISVALAIGVLLVATWAGIGAATLRRALRERTGPAGRLVAAGLGILLLGLPLSQAAENWATHDHSGPTDAQQFWAAVQTGPALPAGAWLIGGWDRYYELRYLQDVDGWRRDLQPRVLDNLLSGGHLSDLDTWLAQGRAVYLTYPAPDILDHFASEPAGALVRVTRRQEAAVVPMDHTVNVRFGDSILLRGYTLRPSQVQPAGTLRITLFWQALQRPPERYVVFTHLVDREQIEHKVGQKDEEPGNGYRPTDAWQPGQQVTDTLDMAVQSGTPSGSYALMVGLYAREDGRRLSATGPDGRALGNYWQMTLIDVGR